MKIIIMLSLIISAYNNGIRLSKTGKNYSFLKDNFKRFEIILAEDDNTDNTYEICR